MSQIQVLRRGYMFCSVSCVCSLCLWVDRQRRHIKLLGLALFKEGHKEIPGPAEFRGPGVT